MRVVLRRAVLAMLLVSPACRAREPEARAPEPPRTLELAAEGCLSLWTGGRCVIPPEGTIALRVKEPEPGARIEVACEAGVEVRSSTVARGERRLQLFFAGGTPRELEVRAVNGARTWEGRVPLEPPRGDALVAELSALARSDWPKARERAKEAAPKLAAGPRAELLEWWSVAEWSHGDVAACADRAEEAIDAARRGARAQLGVRAALRTAFIATHELNDLPRARAALAEITPEWMAAWPPARTEKHRQAGMLARAGADFARAFLELTRASTAAAAANLDFERALAESEHASTLIELGRPAEAIAPLRSAHALLARVAPCPAHDLEVALAWAALLAAENGDPGADDVRRELESALAAYRGPCAAPKEYVSNVLINLALAALQRGDPDSARARLKEARALPMRPEVEAWALDLEGRLAIAARDPRGAEERYRAMFEVARKTDNPSLEWRAHSGLGSAALLAGDTKNAGAAFREAETLLSSDRFRVPIDAGRIHFLGMYRASARGLIEALLAEKRAPEAWLAAREARRRTLLAAFNLHSVSELAPPARAAWESAYSSYLAARSRRESGRLEGADAARLRALEDEVAALRRRALAVLEGHNGRYATLARSSDRTPSGSGFLHGDRARSLETGRARSPAPGELWLLWTELSTGWVCFAATERDLEAIPLGPMPAENDPERIAAWLFTPIAAQLRAAERLLVLPTGTLVQLGVHALPFDGAPLAALRTTAYTLDLPADSPVPAAGSKPSAALVVIDPRGNLPHARREAEEIAATVRKQGRAVTLFVKQDASAAAIIAGLAGAGWFHYAGHGDHLGLEGWDSRLFLAGRDDLDVSDVLTLPKAPASVVLLACRTAAQERVAKDLSSFSVAHAFVLAGSREVLAPAELIEDSRAAELSRALYRALPAHASLSDAFHDLIRRGISTSEYRLLVP